MELRADYPDIHVCTVHPGIVATQFGSNARHGGVDSRTLAGAQSAEDVAAVIAAMIDQPRADVYTREGAQAMVVNYYAAPDMGEAEQRARFMVGGSK